ncbi:Subunit of the glycosylphosphatidylinositol transamidase complex-like protein [Bonamia ostreae]|uniref:Subunit of the glycosylphosphatidylinositol transamidase complex-like protein n=1 Tax=Bonamia ostreae TaxID=126728 RepID=A0ABV2AUG3_9EUKA
MFVPFKSVVKFNFDFQKMLLTNQDYPSDVYRGFDIASATATPIFGKKILSNQVILYLSPPDHTMMYKTITYSSLVCAYFLLNLFYVVYNGPDEYSNRKPLFVKAIIFVWKMALFALRKFCKK